MSVLHVSEIKALTKMVRGEEHLANESVPGKVTECDKTIHSCRHFTYAYDFTICRVYNSPTVN
jgi:hypothetical protein